MIMAIIKLIYFGSVMDITAISGETIEAPETLEKLNAELLSRFPRLSGISYRFSINRQLITGDKPLKDDDEIALLPPFAGG